VATGASQVKRRLIISRQGLEAATLIGVAAPAAPSARMSAAGCCHVPQNTATASGASPGNWLQVSPLAFCPRLTPSTPRPAAPPT
jgi:hypothetical protein